MLDRFTWNTKGILLGLVLSGLLYLVMSQSMQFVTSMMIKGGAFSGGASAPIPILMLLQIRFHVDQLYPPLVGVLGALLLAPAEEIFWRGFIQTRLVRRAGPYAGIVFAAVLYSGFFAVLINYVAAAAALLSGLTFSILTHHQKSLVPAIAGHALLWLLGIWILPLY
ncbi:MAG: CPBP family intramembrane metalloprotease [Desulfobacterales bacterium]|nr:CPBP family intramembrane metalloprotease [Desulfobacterales bacterium]